MTATSIRIKKETRTKVNKHRLYERESYDEIINRVFDKMLKE